MDDESESSGDAPEPDGDDDAETADASAGASEGNGPDADGDPAGSGDPLAPQGAPAGTGTADDAPGKTEQDREAGTADEQADDTEAASETATPSRAVDVAVVTISGDRAGLEDSVTAAFEAAGHAVVQRERLRGGYDAIQQMVDTLVGRDAVDIVVTVGGVGLAADEMAIEAVHPLLEKALPGFGEAFRSRLADYIGTGIVGIRSTAGVSDGTLVFCLPGDADAAELAVSEILAGEAPVLVDQLEA